MTTTEGPWHIAYLDKHGQAVVKGRHIEVATCWHHSVGAIEEEMKANARLIAAAPDLLVALKEVVRISDREHDAWEAARTAIAKAEEANDER